MSPPRLIPFAVGAQTLLRIRSQRHQLGVAPRSRPLAYCSRFAFASAVTLANNVSSARSVMDFKRVMEAPPMKTPSQRK